MTQELCLKIIEIMANRTPELAVDVSTKIYLFCVTNKWRAPFEQYICLELLVRSSGEIGYVL
jgi:hypothetical protein